LTACPHFGHTDSYVAFVPDSTEDNPEIPEMTETLSGIRSFCTRIRRNSKNDSNLPKKKTGKL